MVVYYSIELLHIAVITMQIEWKHSQARDNRAILSQCEIPIMTNNFTLSGGAFAESKR